MQYATTEMDWTRILQQAGVEEPPGYQETVQSIEVEPYVKPEKKKSRSKAKKPRR